MRSAKLQLDKDNLTRSLAVDRAKLSKLGVVVSTGKPGRPRKASCSPTPSSPDPLVCAHCTAMEASVEALEVSLKEERRMKKNANETLRKARKKMKKMQEPGYVVQPSAQTTAQKEEMTSAMAQLIEMRGEANRIIALPLNITLTLASTLCNPTPACID